MIDTRPASACTGSLVAVRTCVGSMAMVCSRTRPQSPMRAPPSHHGHGIPARRTSAALKRHALSECLGPAWSLLVRIFLTGTLSGMSGVCLSRRSMVGTRAGVHRAPKSISSPASERRAPSSHGDGGGGVECDRMRRCCDGRAPPGPTEAVDRPPERPASDDRHGRCRRALKADFPI